jgi:pimeloyl-ACP methyl ester carboxylesterase
MVPLARRLARTWDVCAPDLPGYGMSPHPPRPLSIPALADALRAWMDCLGLERAHLVGNSMGCQVITMLVARCPERVGRLALFGPSMDPRVLPLLRLGLRGAVNMLFEQVAFYPVLVGDYLRAGVRETFAGLQESIYAPTLAQMRDVSAPALVIRGEHDWLVTQAHCQSAAQALPRGRMATLAGGGHVVHYSAPEAAAALVSAFLEGRGGFDDDNRTSV